MEADVPDVLKIIQSPFSYTWADIFGPILAFQGEIQLKRWVDAGLNISRSGKYLIQEELKVVSALNLKFSTIEFRVTLLKHHAGIGAVERVIGSIKNTVSKSVTGPSQLKMDDEVLHTWLNLVI